MDSKLFVFITLLALPILSVSQSRSYFDAAQMYNRLLLENENSVVQVGNFKVKGTPYLFGGRRSGQLFLRGKDGVKTFISYNTYDQLVEFSNNSETSAALYKPDGVLDSFSISANKDIGIINDVIFLKGSFIAASDSLFYQRLMAGKRFSLYKKYKSQLAIVSTNYVQSDLRQFDLETEYYYYDNTLKQLKKLKTNSNFIKKEFKQFDLSTILDNPDFSFDLENSLFKVFSALNG